MFTLKSLMQSAATVTIKINDKWVPARPVTCSRVGRVKAAWAVLTGKADAFTWPEGQ